MIRAVESRFTLDGETAVVTGSASGLGRVIAVGLAQAGARVVLADINIEGLEETATSINEIGGSAIAVPTDVSDERLVERLFDRAEEHFGLVTILVNDAFVPPPRLKPESLPMDAWTRVMAVNLTGYFLCAREAGRRLIASRHAGSIINISSIGGSSGVGRGNLAYSVSKAGVNQLTRELAVEWGLHGIRVNALAPCQFRTPALQRIIDDPAFDSASLIDLFIRGIPVGRLGEPDDIVGPAIFLASSASSMVTGVVLPVDGGNLAMNAGGSKSWEGLP